MIGGAGFARSRSFGSAIFMNCGRNWPGPPRSPQALSKGSMDADFLAACMDVEELRLERASLAAHLNLFLAGDPCWGVCYCLRPTVRQPSRTAAMAGKSRLMYEMKL